MLFLLVIVTYSTGKSGAKAKIESTNYNSSGEVNGILRN